MIKVGIECESIEDQSWGVGRIVNKLLEEISRRPELKKEFKFFLYFKSKIPDSAFLKNDIFVKKIVRGWLSRRSFSFYYYVWLPINTWLDRVHVMFFPANMLPIIFYGKSVVILTEDLYYEMYHGDLPFRYKLAYRIFGNWAARHATKIMAISETSKKNVAKLFKISPGRIFVNQLAVEPPKSDSLTSYQLPVTSNYLLYVGQAFPRRHLKETILAFEKLSPKYLDLHLVAIGADKYNPPIIRGLIEKVNKKLGREAVVHKDYVSDEELHDLYRNAKCLIYVSSREAFGLPPLEALAHGAVSVIADNDLNREIYGQNAFFVADPDSVDDIAATIENCLNNMAKREQIKQSAAQVLSKYTWLAHTNRFLDLAKQVEDG